MKLLPATSFFFFVLLLLVIKACESDVTQKKKSSPEISYLEKKSSDSRNRGVYDSAIFYQRKALEKAVQLKDTFSLQNGYNGQYFNYKKRGDKDSIDKYLQKLYNISEIMNDTLWMAIANQRQGVILYNSDKLEEAFKKYSKAKLMYLQINYTTKAGKVLLKIANLQKKQGNYGASQLSALEGLEYLESTDELKTLGGLYLALSVASKETGKLKGAKKLIDKALALTKDAKAIKKIGKENIKKFKNTKANIFKEQEKYDDAITMYEDLLKDEKGDTLETKRVNANLAYTLFLKNGFNKKSDSLLQNSLSYFSSKDKTSELFSTQLKLAQIYSKIDKKQSLSYVSKALKIAKKTGNIKSIYEALEVKIDQKYLPEDYIRYVKIGKQIEANKENLNYLYANERFDFDKSEKARIASENDKIKAEKSATQFKNRFLILALALIVLIVLTFFIYQKIKRRHKIEKVKTVHVTEARISSKVHDELANDLYKLISQLETTDPEKETILDKLDIIYNQARDVSKQIQTVETGEGFAEELNSLFRSYQSEEVNVLLKRYKIDIWNGISSHIKITVYRVLQELLTNMKKHSNAVLVVVSIEKRNKQLFIQYIDNGRGFAEEISKNGLQNAENRIHAIEGTLTFDTELHTGCKFSINVPV